MRVKEFKENTEKELLQLADNCFAKMEERGPSEQPGNLLQAQFYMNEVDRRHDVKIARRDLILELVIIFLIIAEVVFSIVEGNKQAEILTNMNTSVAATAAIMKDIKTSSQDQATTLHALTVEQTKSIGSLRQMNEELQTSAKKTGVMAEAMQQQLKILQEEQAGRQAEAAKKPKLELDAANVPLNTFFLVPIKAREETDTKSVFPMNVKNLGDAPTRHGILRAIVFAKEVSLECSSAFQRLYEEPDAAVHAITIPFDIVRPNGGNIGMDITVNYPKGQAPFMLMFNVDADELSTATYLGAMTVRPRKLSN